MVRMALGKVMFSVFLVLLVSAVYLHAGGAKQTSAVASVNGVLIPKAYLEREIRRFEEQALNQGQVVDDTQRDVISRQALDTIIDIELLYQESQKRGFQINEERIEEQVSNLRDQFSGGEGYSAALEQIGITDGELRMEFRRQLAIQDMIDTDIAPATSVSEQESLDFYGENPAFFLVPPQVRASHILIQVGPDAGEEEKTAARARLSEIRNRISAGEDFSALAGEFSDDGSGAAGGDLGFFQREQMVEPFADAAFSLQIGQLSEIVTTQFGYHLIKVTDRQEESMVSFQEVQPRIFQYLQREKVIVSIEDLAEQLRDQAETEEYNFQEG